MIAKRSVIDHPRQLGEQQLLDRKISPQYTGFADWFSRQWKRGLSELPALLHTAATVNLLPQIVELESKGIPVEIIATEDDKLFPLEEVQETLKALRGIVDDRLLPLTGIHTKIGAEPGALASMIAFSRDTVYKDEVPVEIKDETPRRDPR